jgi:hypothetical protein
VLLDMRFLANENFPGTAVALIRTAGHEIVWVRIAAPGMSDLTAPHQRPRAMRRGGVPLPPTVTWERHRELLGREDEDEQSAGENRRRREGSPLRYSAATSSSVGHRFMSTRASNFS